MEMHVLDRPLTDDDRWIGSTPSHSQLAAFLIVGSIGLLFAGVQPILLEALVAEHRLSVEELGWSFTIEFLTVGLGVMLAGIAFRPNRLALIGVCAALGLAAANALVVRLSGLAVFADRAAAGFAEGVLVWLTTLMIARSATPARWAGVFLVVQGLLQVGFALALPETLMKDFGANGGFWGAAIVALIAAAASPALPSSMAALPGSVSHGGAVGALSKAALASLAAVFLTYAFFIGFFAYLPQLADQARLTSSETGMAVSLSLAVSIGGSGIAAALAKRITYYTACLLSVVIFAGALFLLWQLPAQLAFIAIAGVYGFFWGFFMPFQLTLVIESDPSRRAVELVPGVQAVGAAAGPLVCSFAVTDQDARGALLAAGICMAAAFVTVTILQLRRLSRSVVAPGADLAS